MLDAQSLGRFLERAAGTGNKSGAFQTLKCDMSGSAAYRIWKRFLHAQSVIRTALAAICPPPKQQADNGYKTTAQATVDHLKEAFKAESQNPIAAYQAATQSFFI